MPSKNRPRKNRPRQNRTIMGPPESSQAARSQRVARAKRVLAGLVDAGVPFNPSTVSSFTRERGAENLAMRGGRRTIPGTRSGSTEASVTLMGGVTSMKAPRPISRRKKKGR